LTLALYGLLAIAIMAALFFIAANFLPAGEQIAPPVRDEAPWNLPMSRALDAGDVASIRLPVALRGYRFAETDVLLDRLGEELRARDLEIARLRGAPVPEPVDEESFRPLSDFRPATAGEPVRETPVADQPEDVPASDVSAADEPVQDAAHPAGDRDDG